MLPDFGDWSRSDLMSFASLLVAAAALIVSVVAAIGSWHQARTAARAHRRAVEADDPTIECLRVRSLEPWPGVLSVEILVTNRSDRVILLRSITRASRFDGLADGKDVYVQPNPNAVPALAAQQPTWKSRIDLSRRLSEAGVQGLAGSCRTRVELVVLRRGLGRMRRRPLVLYFEVVTDTTRNTTKEIAATIPIPAAPKAKTIIG